mgnify:CR=1 FL=1
MCSSDLLVQGRPPLLPTPGLASASAAAGRAGAPPPLGEPAGTNLAGRGRVEGSLGVTLRFPVTSGVLERRATPAFEEDVPEATTSGDSPLVSVVLASFNQASFIKETLESVAGQEYPHWELIVVDDGSQDDSWSRVGAFMEQRPDLRVLALRKENGGLADARNAGLRHVRGEWVAMLDRKSVV